MAQSGVPQWEWSRQHNDWYCYDRALRRYVTATEYNARHAVNVPRTNPTHNAPLATNVPFPSTYGSSPPNAGANYVSPANNSGSARAPVHPSSASSPPTAGPSVRVATLISPFDRLTVAPANASTPALQPDSQASSSASRDRSDINTYDRTSEVRSIVQRSPPESITDPEYLRVGIRAVGRLKGTDGEEETLYPGYKVRARPRNFFRQGRVIKVLWAEPASESNRTATIITSKEFTRGRFGEQVFSKVRRFVVIRESDNYCSALPIVSYGRRGVARPGTIKAEHGIVYVGRNAPSSGEQEEPRRGEAGMQSIPIRVNPDPPTERLEPMSRICYGKVYTIEHNVKVAEVGTIHRDSFRAFLAQFQRVWDIQVRSSNARPKNSQPEDPEESDEEGSSDNEDDDGTDEAARAEAAPRRAIERAIQGLEACGFTREQAARMIQQRQARSATQAQTQGQTIRVSDEEAGEEDDEADEESDEAEEEEEEEDDDEDDDEADRGDEESEDEEGDARRR